MNKQLAVLLVSAFALVSWLLLAACSGSSGSSEPNRNPAPPPQIGVQSDPNGVWRCTEAIPLTSKAPPVRFEVLVMLCGLLRTKWLR